MPTCILVVAYRQGQPLVLAVVTAVAWTAASAQEWYGLARLCYSWSLDPDAEPSSPLTGHSLLITDEHHDLNWGCSLRGRGHVTDFVAQVALGCAETQQ